MGRLSVVEREELWDLWEGGEVAAVDKPPVGTVAVNGEDSSVLVGLEASGSAG